MTAVSPSCITSAFTVYSLGSPWMSAPWNQPSGPVRLTTAPAVTSVGSPGVSRLVPAKLSGRTVTLIGTVRSGSGASSVPSSSGAPASTPFVAPAVLTQAPRANWFNVTARQ